MALIINQRPGAFDDLSQNLATSLQQISALKMQEYERALGQQRMLQEQQRVGSLYEKLGYPGMLAGTPAEFQKQYLENHRLGQEAQALSSLFGNGQRGSTQSQDSMQGGMVGANPSGMMQPSPNIGEVLQAAPTLGQKVLPTLQAQQAETGRQSRHEEKVQIEKEKMKRQSDKDIRSALEKPREQIKLADERIDSLDRLIDLSDKDLRAGTGQQLLSKLGIGNLWLDPNSQEAQAISNSLILNMSQSLKGSISDKDISFLKQMVPSLFNSPEGIRRIAKTMKLAARGSKYFSEEFRDIVKKEGLSVDAEDRAYESSRKKLDVLRDKMFKELGAEAPHDYSVGQEVDGLPNPSSVPATMVITDKQSNKKYGIRNGKWAVI